MERTLTNHFKSVSVICELEDELIISDMSSKISGGRIEAAEALILMELFVGLGGIGARLVAIIIECEGVGSPYLD